MNPYFYSPYKILNKSVLCVLLVFGFSLIFLALKHEVAFAWESHSSFERRIASLAQQNKLEEAMAATDEYLNKYKNEKSCLMWGYNAKGVIFTKMHEYTKAIYAYQESLKEYKLFNPVDEHKDNMRIVLQHIGDLQHALGDYTDAISYYEEGIQVMDNYDSRRYVNKMFVAWSEFYLSRGIDTNLLKQVYEETKPKLREIEDCLNMYRKGDAYSMASKIAFQLGRFDEAIQLEKTLINMYKDELAVEKNADEGRLDLAIHLLYLRKEVEANDVYRKVLWKSVSKSSLALWYWLKGDEMLARRYLEEYFTEEYSSDVARENVRRIIRLDEILPHDMWKEARKQKWFRELIYPNTIDYSTDKYAEQPVQEAHEGIKTYSIENQEKVLKDSPATVFATNASNVFHKRDCSKLNASEGLIKFDTPQKAREAGGLPCNYCKP